MYVRGHPPSRGGVSADRIPTGDAGEAGRAVCAPTRGPIAIMTTAAIVTVAVNLFIAL
jgi:hypothetical protein